MNVCLVPGSGKGSASGGVVNLPSSDVLACVCCPRPLDHCEFKGTLPGSSFSVSGDCLGVSGTAD